MWDTRWRHDTWSGLDQPWDLIVIGGGITGAGILREATRLGLRALLVEQRDFAWGTSSRSSKLVHGGFRYLKEGKLRLTQASVMERQHLLHEGPGLIDPLGFLMTIYKGDFPGRWSIHFGLSVYDLLALRWDHRYYSAEDFQLLAPYVNNEGLQCGFRYGDAQTDDARLVIRILKEADAEGGVSLNYTAAEQLLPEVRKNPDSPPMQGIRLRDVLQDRTIDAYARVLINATGAWADRLRNQLGMSSRIRPLRGSHLIFPCWRLPVAQAVSFWHPIDRRPVFIFPWEGVTLVGTTDVDHSYPLDEEPRISAQEVAYLMAAVEARFPHLNIGLEDILASFAGVRPVIGSQKHDPSQESRDHVVWEENGLLTVTGGKLTTFRLIARDALKAVRSRLPGIPVLEDDHPVLNPVDVQFPAEVCLDEPTRRRLLGRYGAEAPLLVKAAGPFELEQVPGSQILWAELRWAARNEAVVHLDDLLLRRVRLGVLLPGGGAALLPAIRAICQLELGWSDNRWEAEEAAYLQLWRDCYYLPKGEIPDWKALLAAARVRQDERRPRRRTIILHSVVALAAASLAVGVWIVYAKRHHTRH